MIADLLQWTPTQLCSGAIGWGARQRVPESIRPKVYTAFSNMVGVNLNEVEKPLEEYESLSDFFARKLKTDSREFVEGAFCSPSDGAWAEQGELGKDPIVAKGHGFTLETLLASKERASHFMGGTFATIYLAPKDYHRVHAPLAGKLVSVRHVPGRLFPVRPDLIEHIDNVFSLNERVVFDFETKDGPYCLVMVGAFGVGNISITCAKLESRVFRNNKHVSDLPIGLGKNIEAGDELGAFLLGSTVILCASEGLVDWNTDLTQGESIFLGQSLGTGKKKR